MEYLFLGDFYAAFYGNFSDNAEHSHHAIQLCMKPQGELSISLSDGLVTGSGFIISPDIPHKVLHSADKIFLFLFDPETNMGKRILEKYLQTGDYTELPPSLIPGVLSEPVTPDTVTSFVKNLQGDLEIVDPKSIDPRILKALEVVGQNPLGKPSASEIARAVHLSESRLQHLFKEEIGIPIRRYLLWRRIRTAMQLIQNTNDLTATAYDAGFADSAHFSRTFKEMFGVRLKELFKTRGEVQISYLS